MEKKNPQELLHFAHEMIEEGKISEVLEFLNLIEPVDNYTERQKAKFYTLQSKIYFFLGNLPKAYEMAEKGMQFARKTERCLEVLDTFLNMADILIFNVKNIETLNLLEEISEILKSLTKISEKDRKQRMGLIYLYKGSVYTRDQIKLFQILENSIDLLEIWGSQANLARAYSLYGREKWFIGEYNKALSYISKSQNICENEELPQYNIPKLYNSFGIGDIYSLAGDYQMALEYYTKGLSLARKVNIPFFLWMGLNNSGSAYSALGKWEQAIKYLNECIPITENFLKLSHLVTVLDSLFHVYLNMGDKTAAQQIFNKIEQCRDKEVKNKWINLVYRLDKAILMKMSKRSRDWGGAQEIFNNIVHEEVYHIEATQTATLNLCEMLIDEFKETKNPEVLDELSSLLYGLQKAAKNRQSYLILAETYLLEAKLSMINYDLKKARQSLTKAQQIAERYELNPLAIRISNEHDKLLQNLEVWKQMKKENVPISERLEKIDINDQILTMLKKKTTQMPKTTPESPILMLIMADSGIPIYTKIFNKEWKFEEELFSGFLSAFNSFSDEIFSEGLDRASFGKYTILMTAMPPLMSCYVFKGQSFLAHQKFSKFNENIHDSEQLWKILITANRTGRVINNESSLMLGNLVKSIF